MGAVALGADLFPLSPSNTGQAASTPSTLYFRMPVINTFHSASSPVSVARKNYVIAHSPYPSSLHPNPTYRSTTFRL